MGEAASVGERVELVGGILDGLVILYGPGGAPAEVLRVERVGSMWTYHRTGHSTAGGASVFRLAAT
jgi:hypothetical protein